MMVTQAEVDKFIEVSGRTGVLDRHSQIGIAIARECLDSRNRVASLEAERDKLKESISHFSGLLGEETQKRYTLEAERDTASHNAEHYANLCIKAEAERDRAVELLKEHVDVCLRSEAECPYCAKTESFLASIGGEGKNG